MADTTRKRQGNPQYLSGTALKRRMLIARMTVTELALVTGLGKPTISHLANGDFGASLPVIRDILAPALGCEPEDLYLPHVLAFINGTPGATPGQDEERDLKVA